MTTDKQIVANKANALKGGVKTREGKEIVSKNAITHWLTAQRLISEKEKRFYESILDKIIRETQPDGYLEMVMCERIAFHQMRLLRSVWIESMFIETHTLQSEIECLEMEWVEEDKPKNKPLNTGYKALDLLFGKEDEMDNKYQVQTSLLKERIRELQKNYISLSSFDTLEKIQRYDTNLENRLLKTMREYQKLKEMKKGKAIIDITIE